MRRVLPTSALVIAGLFATACSDQRSPLPTEPPLSPSLTGRSCPSPLQLAALTVALFTPGDLLNFARSTQSNINLKMSRGDITGARKLALAFVDFTLQSYYQGKLRDPNGANPPTTAGAVVTVIDGILCWVGLQPSGLDLTRSADVTVTTKVIGKDGGQLVAGDKLSGLKVTAGTVLEDGLWVITRRDDLAKNGTCVSTTLTQIPLCIDFSGVPAQTVAKPVLVVICQPADRQPLDRRLAHKLPDNKVELLAVVPDPFAIEVERIGLDCTTTPGFEPSGLGSIGRAVWQFGSLVMRVLGPKRLHASHYGLGGLLGPKLSPVTAVQVRLSFDVQPSNTEPSSPITPAVQVALRDLGTGALATEITNRIKVGIGTNPGEATLGGDTIQPPSNGIATFANLRINNPGTGYTLAADALSSTFTGDSLIHTPGTSTPFDVGSPDLVISSAAPTVAPNPAVAGSTVGLSAWTIKNRGSAPVSNGTVVNVAYFLSSDAAITRTDVFLGSTFVTSAGMAPGQEISGPALVFTIPAATTPGSYWIGILADQDNAVTESNEANNFVSTPLTVTGAATPGTINFEVYPNGEPTCVNCPLAGEYASRGVVFSFSSTFTALTNAQLFLSSSYDPVDGPSNHSVTSAAAPAGGFFSGILTLSLSGPPTSITFQVRGTNSAALFPVSATDPFEQPIPDGQITRSNVSTYTPAGAIGPFRQETITITNTAGIAQVQVMMNGFIVLVDNLTISP